jgi:hypothetical protein
MKKVASNTSAPQTENSWGANRESIAEYHKIVVYNNDIIEQLRTAKKSSYILVVGPSKSAPQKRYNNETPQENTTDETEMRSTITITKFTGAMFFLNPEEQNVGHLNYVHLIGVLLQDAEEVSHPEFGTTLQLMLETKISLALSDGQTIEKNYKHEISIVNSRLFPLKARFTAGTLVYVNGFLADNLVIVGDSYMNGQIIIMTPYDKKFNNEEGENSFSNRPERSEGRGNYNQRRNTNQGGRFSNENNHSQRDEKNPLLDFFK